MYVTHLHLVDYRSYAEIEVPLQPGVCVFVGSNGQGKTNLVEAVEYLATLSSHRVAADAPLVRAGAERATVRARVQAGIDDTRSLLLELDIVPGKANRAKLNRAPLKRARDLLGALVVVLFSPEDLSIVKGDPSERRGFLDDLLVARWPRFAGIRADYDRVLRQRNALLKSLSGRTGRVAGADVAATLDTWDEHLAQLGAELVVARIATLTDLAEHVADAYRSIAPINNEARAAYTSGNAVVADVPLGRDEIAEVLRVRMSERRGEEIARGVSLVGPHRDDIALQIGELPAKGYASHGESWSLACALRLAAFRLLRADGIEPVLILDDVFAELDITRRQRLAMRIADAEQVLITAAVAADVPVELGGRRFRVDSGAVTPEDEGDD
ncbi:MAG TPA: DNA replication/repair protein RecF [Cellulomonadaceae bacterium]|nr:DNA replication/repair protein RecF [Cellulomonadaceae bacterium]